MKIITGKNSNFLYSFIFFLFLFLIFFLLCHFVCNKRNILETFDSPRINLPLEINNNKILDPTNWKWLNKNTIQSQVTFATNQGEIDYKQLVARPQLGFPTNWGGLGYNAQGIQSNHFWYAWNDATGGTGWFWWNLSNDWNNLSKKQKRKQLILDIFINNEGLTPIFPVEYSITCPDYSFSRSVHVFVEFTKNPMNNMNPLKSKLLPPPILLKSPTIFIQKNQWDILNDNYAIAKPPLSLHQGEIDWEKINKKTNSWFSWSVKNKTLIGTINNSFTPPSFPARYKLTLKDKHRERYLKVTIVLLGNPFVKNKKKLIKLCPQEIPHSGLRCCSPLPQAFKSLCQHHKQI
jgi:hypothetical protein